ncbi:hypothetical protein [Vibrio navarrensis]|uniref:hypothetical protein n=1 Tax=Vibrio navarrensis TaxID=29495 RepID=UPI0018DD1A64|nr:hypothetical protein [Vibrio navarrensis]MBH9740102.1 hypothetical protein [Vibrio navarrensis]
MSELKQLGRITESDKDVTKTALEIIIDGVASSDANHITYQAGIYLAGLILADTKGQIDAEKQKAILSIIKMASDIETPAFISK